MKRTTDQLYELLITEDEITVCELLDLASEELVSQFKYKIDQRKEYLRKYYGEEESSTPFKKELPSRQTEAMGIGSREVWENAGFSDFDEDY